MSTPLLGRNARIYKDGVAIAYGKGINRVADAEVIKVRSMDSVDPALTAAGAITYKFTMRRLYTNGTWLSLLKAGTSFTMVFAPKGATPPTAPYETWTGCVVLHVGVDAGEDDGVLSDIGGEMTGISVTDA